MSSVVLRRLAACLSAAEARSGEDLGKALGCSRTAVQKHIETLRGLGVDIDAVTGQGYRLREPLELLDEGAIIEGLSPAIYEKLGCLDIEATVDSSNSAVQRLAVADQHRAVVLAEHQSGGRGRRGRQWHSPFGRNLYLSLGWKFGKPLAGLGCLPLVAALSVARALSRAGLKGHRIKWPNDLLLDGRKLSGCLVEVQGDAQGPCHAVIGVGINVHMPRSNGTETAIDQPWTDLHSRLPGFSRNALAVLLLEELTRQLEVFADRGFAPFQEHWHQMDGLRGQVVKVFSASSSVEGTARGIDDNGALLLDTGTEVLSLHSGEVSLRQVTQDA